MRALPDISVFSSSLLQKFKSQFQRDFSKTMYKIILHIQGPAQSQMYLLNSNQTWPCLSGQRSLVLGWLHAGPALSLSLSFINNTFNIKSLITWWVYSDRKTSIMNAVNYCIIFTVYVLLCIKEETQCNETTLTLCIAGKVVQIVSNETNNNIQNASLQNMDIIWLMTGHENN